MFFCKKNLILLLIFNVVVITLSGCGQDNNKESEPQEIQSSVDFSELTEDETIPVIIRDEQMVESQDTETEESSTIEQVEIIPFVDRVRQQTENNITPEVTNEQDISYNIEAVIYEEGTVKVTYPQISDMQNTELQSKINESIKKAVLSECQEEGLTFYELDFETASKGSQIVSFIFKGNRNYESSAYPSNIVKTLNIDLSDGENLRLKDYADIAFVVSNLEAASGYMVLNEGVTIEDFSAFLNNGYVTDYAITLLDYDIDFSNSGIALSGYSAIRNNHLVLFIEAEHSMGDYVELEFKQEL